MIHLEHNNRARENWIDVAKGIAMLLIIIGHVSGNMTGWWNFKWVYGIHVMMFFLLSGYTLKPKSLKLEYVNVRFGRLMIPYFITCFMVMIMDLFNSRYILHDCSINRISQIIGQDLIRAFFASGNKKVFGTVETGSRIGAIWFLPALFFATIIAQYILQKVKDVKWQAVLFACVALTAYITKDFFWLPFSIQSGMMGAFFLWIGYVVRENNVFLKLKRYHWLFAQGIFIWGVLGGYAAAHIVDAYVVDIFLTVVVGLSGCLLLALISKKAENYSVLSYIGRISLTILCVHLFALETLADYFIKSLDWLRLEGNLRVWILIAEEVAFAILVAICIENGKGIITNLRVKMRKVIDVQYHKESRILNRDKTTDIARGIFIIAMLIGHFRIDGILRSIIYSCHMAAFIFLSGYFYKSPSNIKKTILHMIWTFIVPYMIFVGLFIVLNYKNWSVEFFKSTITQYLMGISFTNKLFVSIPSVGPVYFILLLFMTRLIYMVMARLIDNEKIMAFAVIIVSLAGMVLGEKGIWLPWSFDIAMYGVALYYIGVLFQRYSIMIIIRKNRVLYFALSAIWAYMIYAGSMEIAIRNYGRYGLVILGSVCGICLVVMLSGYIKMHMPISCCILNYAGKYSLYIIIVHVLLGGMISRGVGKVLEPGFLPYMIGVMAAQVGIAILAGVIIDTIKDNQKRKEAAVKI